MAIAANANKGEITLGPVLFNWNPERWRDFYFRIADEAPLSLVYLGEAICHKRAPFFEPHHAAVVERLTRAGKKVVLSTLAEVMLAHDRRMVERTCGANDIVIEANDASALFFLGDRPHHIGPYINVYNEETVRFLAKKGARSFCLPPEMPATAIGSLCQSTRDLGVGIEVQVFGRVPLALSARCYHARAHNRTKDSCQFVCEDDPNGLELRTLEGVPFLTINGVQTLSYDYLNLISELPALSDMGVSRFRLSPQTDDMVRVASLFSAVLARHITAEEGAAALDEMNFSAPFSNGFYHHKPGHLRAV
jgi:collagenase-like PrtC family protease